MQAIGKHISLHLLLNLGCTTDLGYRPGGILSQWTCTKSCVISGQLYHSLSSPYMQLTTPPPHQSPVSNKCLVRDRSRSVNGGNHA